MQRHGVLAYGLLSYLMALLALIYLFMFTGNFGIATGIDSPARMHWIPAVVIDLCLLLLFALQHSLMARKPVKAFLVRFVSPTLERSSYVLLSSGVFILMFAGWQPIDAVVWSVESNAARGILYGMFVFGWLTVLIAISLTNHFDLFGIRQVWSHFRTQRYRRLAFTTRWLYRYVRHPLYLGWLFAFWSAPVMTAGHLLFAAFLSAYIIVAIPWEEKDLVAEFGKRYTEYRERVPKLIPSVPFHPRDEAYVLDRTGRYAEPEALKARDEMLGRGTGNGVDS